MSKKNTVKILKLFAMVITGNALYAIAVIFFIVPSGLILGGFTGLSIAITHFVEIKASYAVAFFHAFAFVAGAIVLGKKFAISTAASTILYPLFFRIFEQVSTLFELPVTNNIAVNLFMAVLLIGISLGMLTSNNTSTGGTEVIPLIIHKLTGRSVGFMLFVIDAAIMLFQLSYSDFSKIIYGILLVTAYSVIVHIINHFSKEKEQEESIYELDI